MKTFKLFLERNYAKEYENYQGKPEQIEKRSSRNKARRLMAKKMNVKGKDVGHKDNDPLNNDPKNLRLEDPGENRREPRMRDNPVEEGIRHKGLLHRKGVKGTAFARSVNKTHSQNQKDQKDASARSKAAAKDHADFRKKYPNIKFDEDYDPNVHQEGTPEATARATAMMFPNEELDEVLNIKQRRDRGISARKNKTKMAMGRRKAANKIASTDKLKKRAQRQARTQMALKIAKDGPKKDMTPARKAEIEKRLDKMRPRINNIAKRMMKDVRKAEIARKRGKK